MKTVEICTSREWLEVFSTINFDGINDIGNAVDTFIDVLTNELIDAGFEVIGARGERATCHGWNNANTLEYRFGPVKSFTCLSNDECGMIRECIDLAEESMRMD